ncbi:MAG: hypothetical protein EPN22_02490 [Nitrospirae bacterium]|nr:MAG: hypothetical protein EPN22_02490 [Nitrospirota bacterium]
MFQKRSGIEMQKKDLEIVGKFKALVSERVKIYELRVFGSRARGDASQYSDMDILVLLGEAPNNEESDYISDCAWEAGFEHGVVVIPVIFSRNEWENSPERYSLLAQAVEKEGVLI